MRLTALLGVLITGMTLLLGVPWATSTTLTETRATYYELSSDAVQLATQTSEVTTAEDAAALQAALERYDEVYRTPAFVVDTRATVQQSSRPGYMVPPEARAAVRMLTAGALPPQPERVWPWEGTALVTGQPVIRHGDLIGAVVILDPDGRRTRGGVHPWTALVVFSLVALAASVALALGLARWVLRPVHDLGDAASLIRDGALDTRVPVSGGPPELKHLAEAFNQMADRVQEMMHALQNFVSDASHQLRNPLNTLLLRVEALRYAVEAGHPTGHTDGAAGPGTVSPGAVSPGPAISAAESVLQDGQRLSRILEDMLTVARATHARGRADLIDVAGIVDERLRTWSVVAGRRGVTLARTGAKTAVARHSTPCVEGALDNVVDNALKYSGEQARIEVHVGLEDDAVTVRVRDQGPGLLVSELPKATERGWRGRRHAEFPGTGLGLPIARDLLARHGGALDIANLPTGGLEVRFTLPRDQPSPEGRSSCSGAGIRRR